MLLEAGLAAAARRWHGGPPVPRAAPVPDPRSSRARRGFGGRLLGPGEPKYLNSPENPIFHKGRQLYNLHQAKSAIRKEETVILVEGYFDVLRLVLAGIEHVVAPLGTALTPDQATLLRRFAPSAILLYDSDQAGLRATFRAGDELLRHSVRVRVATMPPGEDPDTLVRRGGAAALEPIAATTPWTCSSASFSSWSRRAGSRAWTISVRRSTGCCPPSEPRPIRSRGIST